MCKGCVCCSPKTFTFLTTICPFSSSYFSSVTDLEGSSAMSSPWKDKNKTDLIRMVSWLLGTLQVLVSTAKTTVTKVNTNDLSLENKGCGPMRQTCILNKKKKIYRQQWRRSFSAVWIQAGKPIRKARETTFSDKAQNLQAALKPQTSGLQVMHAK